MLIQSVCYKRTRRRGGLKSWDCWEKRRGCGKTLAWLEIGVVSAHVLYNAGRDLAHIRFYEI